MEIVHQFFPEILNDNDAVYFAQLSGLLESIDEYAELEISKFPDSYNFRLVASHPRYNNMLIQELVKFHNMFNIFLDISKSIKSTGTIMFKIIL